MSYTPINDFVNEYKNKKNSRFHMPGHKGIPVHGMEPLDITEIKGADYLYEAEGIIAESEELTSRLFGTERTLYSTEGSSLSIKSMLAVIAFCCKDTAYKPYIIASRNVHKAFIDGCCLLDIDVDWVYAEKSGGLCSSLVTADEIEYAIKNAKRKPDGVYVTSPDYLGNILDIESIAKVCHKYGVILAVDNAHGAYLKFLEKSCHPIDLGADICADSAHKTLPVYTGGSYLHISANAPKEFAECAKSAMSLFASTSPSYLIMQSLDKCCGELYGELPEKIRRCGVRIADLCGKIKSYGWDIRQNEPLKLTIYANKSGYRGSELSQLLREYKIECEYADVNCVVLMISPYNTQKDFQRFEKAMKNISQKEPIIPDDIKVVKAVKKMTIRQAYFSSCRNVSVENAEGKICARSAISCQPSVPVIAPGELVTSEIVKILKKYGILTINVL